MGVSRSSGCLLCVQRRVKCDQRTPGCAKCETYGQPCPGYNRGFKFVQGKPHRTRRRPNHVGHDAENISPAVYLPKAQTVQPLSLTSPDLNVMQSLDVLIDEVSRPFPATSAYVISRWLTFLPSVYGRNRTLDSTIRCFASHYIGNMAQNNQALWYSKFAYVEALRKLRVSLNNFTEGLSSEVFCAVLLLCLYELFANKTDSAAWMKHAKGLSQLAEIRGCDRYVDEFDHTLLKASRGMIVMHSVFSGQSCFLASEDWHAVMKSHVNPGLSSGLDRQVEEFFAYFTSAPRLIHELFELKDSDVTSPETHQKMSEVAGRTLKMQSKLLAWYERFIRTVPLPSEALSSSNDKLFPTVLMYSDVNSGSLYCGYYSYMLLVHEILSTCGLPGEHSAMVIYFRDQICKSVEYNARGFLGPYRMGFPLRAAYETADPITKEWIDGWLERLSRAYAALQPRNFKS